MMNAILHQGCRPSNRLLFPGIPRLRQNIRFLPESSVPVTNRRRNHDCPSVSSSSPKEDDDDDLRLEVARAHASQSQVRLVQDQGSWGVVADRNFDVGELVLSSRALRTTSSGTSHSIQTDWNQHVLMDLPARFLNHGCFGTASVGIRTPKGDGGACYDFVAIQEISKGDGILFDYDCTEYNLAEPFSCQCGSPTCRGTIRGFRHHGEKVLLEYGGTDHVAPYLLSPNP